MPDHFLCLDPHRYYLMDSSCPCLIIPPSLVWICSVVFFVNPADKQTDRRVQTTSLNEIKKTKKHLCPNFLINAVSNKPWSVMCECSCFVCVHSNTCEWHQSVDGLSEFLGLDLSNNVGLVSFTRSPPGSSEKVAGSVCAVVCRTKQWKADLPRFMWFMTEGRKLAAAVQYWRSPLIWVNLCTVTVVFTNVSWR